MESKTSNEQDWHNNNIKLELGQHYYWNMIFIQNEWLEEEVDFPDQKEEIL